MIRSFILWFNYFTLFYVLCINSIYFVQFATSMFSLYGYMKRMKYSDFKKYISSINMIPISVIVPAYDEEETVIDNVKSLLSLNYSTFEIVVVNDGSNDNTLNKIIEQYDLKPVNLPFKYEINTQKIKGIYKNIDIPGIVVVDKENGGKADALNAGINISKYPVFCAVDADSILESDSLARVIMPFIENSYTVAVGGIVRIANGIEINEGNINNIFLPKNKIAMFQIVEYLRAFLNGRIGWDALGSLLIISGAFGAFKKSVVIKVGGYTTGTIGEDMELVLKLHKYLRENHEKYRIKFIPDPVCWTQAPERIKDLRAQRRRWQIGLMDSLFRHKDMFLNYKYGMAGIFGTPYFWIFEMFGPAIEVTGYILVLISYFFGILNFEFFLLFLAVSILYGVLLSIGAILLEEYTFNKYPSMRQLFSLTLYGILENFGYRQLTTLFRIEGMIKYKKHKNSWGKIKRSSFDSSSPNISKESFN